MKAGAHRLGPHVTAKKEDIWSSAIMLNNLLQKIKDYLRLLKIKSPFCCIRAMVFPRITS